jgi:hypothetical protein
VTIRRVTIWHQSDIFGNTWLGILEALTELVHDVFIFCCELWNVLKNFIA